MTEFYEMQDLPTNPPELSLNENPVATYTIDWRVPGGEVTDTEDDLDKVVKLGIDSTSLDLRLRNSATPSAFRIGLYGGGLSSFDPTSRPEIDIDCLTGSECQLSEGDGFLGLNLAPLWPENAEQAVFVVAASYLSENDNVPYSNSVIWVIEVSR